MEGKHSPGKLRALETSAESPFITTIKRRRGVLDMDLEGGTTLT